MNELFHMLGRALRPSNAATPSIDHPGPKVYGQLSPDDTDGLDFICVKCGYEFFIQPQDYRGEFDHPPSEPVCPECREKEDE